jgi:hypothetical protein
MEESVYIIHVEMFHHRCVHTFCRGVTNFSLDFPTHTERFSCSHGSCVVRDGFCPRADEARLTRLC